eukprot:1531221-Pyramimonas_sp.AAC.1
MDAPRAVSLNLTRTPRGLGLRPTYCDEGLETCRDILTATHVDGIKIAGTEDTIDKCVKVSRTCWAR